MKNNFNWEDFEEITKSVIDVICGDKVEFICSGRKCNIKNHYGNNQFDVLYRWNSNLKTSYIAIECKYWNSKVDKEDIRNFQNKCEDCKIDTKIIISKIGFTNRAIKEAKGKNIELIELRSFNEEDFNECFKNRILAINLEMNFLIPEIKCEVKVQSDEDLKMNEEVPIELCNIYLISESGSKENLINYIPHNNSGLELEGFIKKSQDLSDGKSTEIYEKIINCSLMETEEKIIKTKGVLIRITTIYDKNKNYKTNLNIDFKEEIKKAGYLIAKRIIEKSNFVLDLKRKIIVDNN